MYKSKTIISVGNFLFKYRNFIFPLTLVLMFLIKLPSGTFLGSHSLEVVKDWVAVAMGILGLLIRAVVIGFAYIKRGGLNKKVYADDLVTTGIFSICRNPLYVGNVIIYFGIFLMHGDLYVILFGTLLFLFVYISLIAAEENFLYGKFGPEFENYCAATPRWIPVISKFREAVTGMKFNFKKVLLKDYTTIINTAFAFIAIEMYEQVFVVQDLVFAKKLAYALPVTILALIVIKIYKKQQAAKAAAAQ